MSLLHRDPVMEFFTSYNPVDEFLMGTMPMQEQGHNRRMIKSGTGGGMGSFTDQSVSSTCTPCMDILEHNECYIYFFDMPGIGGKEDIDLSIEENILCIKADKCKSCCCTFLQDKGGMPEFKEDNVSYRRHERPWGRFEKFIRLPSDCDIGKVCCHYENGVLCIHIGRLAPTEAKRKLQIL